MKHTNGYAHSLSGTIVSAAACILLTCTVLAFSDEPDGPREPRVSIEPRVRTRDSAERTSTNIRVSSNLVLIPVTVTDHFDRFVTGLEKPSFRLYEDKVEQTILHFTSEDAPISIGVVFDCSSSMDHKISKSREAVGQFLKTANPGDEFSLVTFANYPQLLVRLTREAAEIQRRLAMTRPSGRTALLDAIEMSIREMKNAHHSRKALLIISDGGDNCSRYTMREIKNLVREADVQIYAIGILEPFGPESRPVEELAGPGLLREITEQTGGLMFEVNNWKQLPDVASKIGVALRHQYVLGYSPADLQNDGKYHRVQVKLDLPKGGPKLRASWRLGYYAPKQ